MSTQALPIGREVKLSDRYDLDSGPMMASGVQAIVRLVYDQMREDEEAGRRTGSIVSGYPGSPLGGLDREFARQAELGRRLGVHLAPGVNEELAATSVWGSQLVPGIRGADVEGVLGVWYGKAPGVERSGDALRHGNFIGAHPLGGLLAICGDDPGCKSSTLPAISDQTLASLRMPTIAPGDPGEILELGRHAIALSRTSGLWAGLKVVSNVADAVMSVDFEPHRPPIVPVQTEYEGAPYVHRPNADLIAPAMLEAERTLMGPRLELARLYARANGLNPVFGARGQARFGIVAAGCGYYDLREALEALGIGEQELAALGVRVLKLGMSWPLVEADIEDFAEGLGRLLVVEDKGPFIETEVCRILYASGSRPQVLGSSGPDGAPLLAPTGLTDYPEIARAVLALLGPEAPAGAEQRLEQLRPASSAEEARGPARLPYFCSGCPHNLSTDAPDDALVGAGIGCHGMVVINREGKGDVVGVTQMGGEGAQWIGQSPFVDGGDGHLIQNLGDGTFHHSASLAVRAAVAADLRITYKLLYNSAVAMTGGQNVGGSMAVPDLARALAAEGVERIIVTSDDPSRYRGAELPSIASVRPRDGLDRAQRELAAIDGVTVLIHDQACAAEQRRLRKRGLAPEPPQRLAINSRVCEGCGDCEAHSHCLSLVPTETEFGLKTQIDQTSCNKDFSCLDGRCPSFVSVIPDPDHSVTPPAPPDDLPEPEIDSRAEATIRLVGIGGTGVVTVAQVLGMAAMLDGREVKGLDQTGIAQKGGSVVSDVRILSPGQSRAGRAPGGSVDTLLALDLVAALSPANIAAAGSGRTVAVATTGIAQTGAELSELSLPSARLGSLLERLERHTDASRNVYLDGGRLAERLYGRNEQANTIVLGAAWQSGRIPVSLAAIETAFRLNGVAVDRNLQAFAWGRAAVAAPDATARLERGGNGGGPGPEASALVAEAGLSDDAGLRQTLEVRVEDLRGYQGDRYARAYLEDVGSVRELERRSGAEGADGTESYARGLHKLMAYKDEYEVARLHLDPLERERLSVAFGPRAKVRYMLHPPLLRVLGLKRKIPLGAWFDPAFRLLRAMRRLRGTPLDPFGISPMRRLERKLPGEYTELAQAAAPRLGGAQRDLALEALGLAALVKGYDEVKLAGVADFRARAAAIRAELES